jgi:protein TonB
VGHAVIDGRHDASRPVAAVAVVGLHVLVLAGLMAASPIRVALEEGVPVEAFLIAGAEPEPVSPMPEVSVELAPIEVEPPELPVIEEPPLESSITLPVAMRTIAPTSVAVNTLPDSAQATPIEAITVQYVVPPTPRYPQASRREREEGVVTLRVLVDTTGHPTEVDVLESSGSARLDEAARQAVLQAVFRPYSDGVRPRAAYVRVPIEFSLRHLSRVAGRLDRRPGEGIP